MRFIDREEVARRLTYERLHPPRARRDDRLLRAVKPGSFSAPSSRSPRDDSSASCPARLERQRPSAQNSSACLPENAAQGKQSHQGLVVLFDPDTGAPVCVVHAGEVTAIRTAAASAVATDALALPDAKHLAILGTGEQAATHARAIAKVRSSESITIWGRSPQRAQAFAAKHASGTRLPHHRRRDREEAAAKADIICTVTAASRAHPQGRMGSSPALTSTRRLQPRRSRRDRQRSRRPLALLRRQPRRHPADKEQSSSAPSKPASSTTATSSPKSARCCQAKPKAAAPATRSPSTNPRPHRAGPRQRLVALLAAGLKMMALEK